jgi:hypothetical protein
MGWEFMSHSVKESFILWHIGTLVIITEGRRCRPGRDRMVVGFTTTCTLVPITTKVLLHGGIGSSIDRSEEYHTWKMYSTISRPSVWFSFNVTFINISVISWRSVLMVEDTEVPAENHRAPLSYVEVAFSYRVYFCCSIHVNLWIFYCYILKLKFPQAYFYTGLCIVSRFVNVCGVSVLHFISTIWLFDFLTIMTV